MAVEVGGIVGVNVGKRVRVCVTVGVRAMAVPVPAMLAASAVHAITVGKYSGGYGVGMGLAVGAAQEAKNPSRNMRVRSLGYINELCHCEEGATERSSLLLKGRLLRAFCARNTCT